MVAATVENADLLDSICLLCCPIVVKVPMIIDLDQTSGRLEASKLVYVVKLYFIELVKLQSSSLRLNL